MSYIALCWFVLVLKELLDKLASLIEYGKLELIELNYTFPLNS
jgi:hypothetical protein